MHKRNIDKGEKRHIKNICEEKLIALVSRMSVFDNIYKKLMKAISPNDKKTWDLYNGDKLLLPSKIV